ncbi:MAG: A/G-specific adenine glycosylase [Acidobacteria bacterium]|nr:MAG: A/G-specific adenine glycosylase [Acidobacteriota bacterium]
MLDSLVAWFQENQRPLPWRVSYDPYQVWVSEVMLQQTQVETALPYYERFIREFPTIESLAKAKEERVLTLWAGLGYYQRAKNLTAAAGEVVSKHGGEIPSDYDALIRLPGIGQYMAGAILSIAFNKAYPVVDGNVRRVLSRINGWTEDDTKTLWDAATRLVHEAEPRLVNQALMELGAKICSFKSPRCLLCPVQSSCIAFRVGMQDKIPPVKKRPATVHVHLFAVVHKKDDRYLMKPADGMWEFPMFSALPAGSFEKIGECRHTITHHRLDVTVCEGELTERSGLEWKRIDDAAISSLTRKVWDLAKELGDRTGEAR